MSRPPVAPKTLRIVDQVRTRDGFAYDFAVEERRVTITIEETREPEGWRVDAKARDRSNGAEHTARAEACTRAQAIRAVGDQWREAEHAAPAFDWRAIETLLGEVRAL